MDFLKEVFGTEALTWEQFSNAVSQRGFKVADLATGNYVSKKKYDDDLKAKTTSIEDLTSQLATRDADIASFQKSLKDSKIDAAKFDELNAQIEKMQTDNANMKQEYENRLNAQSYEFAVKEYSNGLSFTSKAAKQMFEQSMIAEKLKMKNGVIIGADDYKTAYMASNEDSFVKAPEDGNPGQGDAPKPTFGQPTPRTPDPEDTNSFASAFSFGGVRPHDTN